MNVNKGKILINVNDIIGERLGKLEVIGYHGRMYQTTKGGERIRHYYKVKCDCGKVKVIRRCQILNKTTHSCGCLK